MKDSLLFLRRGIVVAAFTGTMIAILSYSSEVNSAPENHHLSPPVPKESPKSLSKAPARAVAGKTIKGNAYSLTTAQPVIIAD